MSEFVIDILVGSAHADVRDTALEQFHSLSSHVDISASDGSSGSSTVSPHLFILNILLKARLPFWVTSSNTRDTSYR